MAPPPRIRINAQFPFPSLVTSSGPITITKQSGIWSVGLNFTNLAPIPNGVSPASIGVMVYNAVTQTFQQGTLNALLAAPVSNTRTVTATGAQSVLSTDNVILISQSVPALTTFTLPLSSTRYGLGPFTFKDIKGTAAGNNITLTASGGDLIDGQASFVMNNNYEAVTLYPLASGGYWIG